MPRVSIIMASYNHEKFVQEAIQSVLDQSFQDFELIIIDDASTDNTVNVIKKFNDARIDLTVLEQNQGQFVATNLGLEKASGEYIGILNSDDAFYPQKLHKQITYLDNNLNIGAVFSFVEMINEKSRPMIALNDHYFNKNNRTRHEWLNYFFFYGNCLCHPSVLIRAKCHQELGYYDPRFANCADLQFWIRLTAKYNIHIIQEKLTKFRMLDKNGNMSGNSHASQKRTRWEDYQAKLQFFNGLLSEDDFFIAFQETKKFIHKKHHPYFTDYLLARAAIEKKDFYLDALSLQVLFNMMNDTQTRHTLEEYYNFSLKNLTQLTGQLNPFQMTFPFSKKIRRWIKKFVIILRLPQVVGGGGGGRGGGGGGGRGGEN